MSIKITCWESGQFLCLLKSYELPQVIICSAYNIQIKNNNKVIANNNINGIIHLNSMHLLIVQGFIWGGCGDWATKNFRETSTVS